MEVGTIKARCQIVQDLLPLYVEKLTSPESNQLVEKHLGQCQECREQAEAMAEEMATKSLPEPAARDEKGRRLVRRIRKRVRLTAAALLAVLVVNLYFLWGEGIRFSAAAMIRLATPLAADAEIVARDSFGKRQLLVYDDGLAFGFHTYNQFLGLCFPRTDRQKYPIPNRPFEVLTAWDEDIFLAVVKQVEPKLRHFVAGNDFPPPTLAEARENPALFVAEADEGFAWFWSENLGWGELNIGAYDARGKLIAHSSGDFSRFAWEDEADDRQEQ